MLHLKHVELRQANDFVATLHRHHKPVVGHRFSVGVQRVSAEDSVLVGVAICGRPVARGVNHLSVLEVTRLCTDGTKNACSILYAACARAADALGYDRAQTYILEGESGTSLIAAGWVHLHDVAGRQWTGTDGKPRRTDQPTCDKQCWGKQLR